MITTHEEVENSMKQTIPEQSTTNITVAEELLQGKTHTAEIEGWQEEMLSSPASLQAASRQLSA